MTIRRKLAIFILSSVKKWVEKGDMWGLNHQKTQDVETTGGIRWIYGITLLNHLEVVGKWLAASYTGIIRGMFVDILPLTNNFANAGNS
jgi:hypothetical protein